MKKFTNTTIRFRIVFSLLVLGLIAAVSFLPNQFHSKAYTETAQPKVELDNYDIRTDKTSMETLMSFRQAAGRNAVQNADVRDKFVAGEKALRQSVPTLAINYHKELGVPEVIAPDVLKGRALMTQPSNAKRADVLRGFAKNNADLIGLTDEQINNLKVTGDYTNPNGELSFVDLEQTINGIPVLRAAVRAAFNKQGAMFRVLNSTVPEVEYSRVSTEFGNPSDAVLRAAGYLNYTLKQTTRNDAASTDMKAVFGLGDSATTAEKMYFPVEIGVVRPAWRVLVWETGDAYYVIVDAETGAMLLREGITYDQTQAATYNVYANTTNLLQTMPNPAPLAAPGLLDPTLGTQPPLQPRTNVTLIGNEAPNSFNNLGWIPDNSNGTNGQTVGNNASAGVDRDNVNGADSFVSGTNRVFNFSYTPGAGPNNTGGDDPLLPAYQNGVVTNLFYATNRYHDILYPLGFTEAARNFQNDNFGRGGAAADRVLAEAQDNTVGSSCSAQPCVNNANFSTPADGSSGRMQMYLWNQPTPDRDGDLDAEIIVHELTHGTFGRLHTGSISNTQAGQMNEGNSDFFAHVLLSNFSDPINTVSTTGGYATLLLRSATFTSNYYYGIRRFPKAVLAFRGGPNNRPHNPLTFADIDPAQINLTDGAFAPAFTGSATAVHDGGEIWSSMLWEVRARLVQRLGAEAGNKKVLQLVMDGMKVSPSGPSMINERNAIISAAQANGNTADIGDIWAGFALRGMGFNATNTTGNTVVEGYDLPNAALAETGFSVSDAAPGGDGDGFPEPGETVQLTVPVTNQSGNSINNVVATVTNGGTADYGSIANAQTVVRQISYTIPANAACGSLHTVTINVTSAIGSSAAQARSFQLGVPAFGATTQNFDGVTAPALPTGWSQENSGTNTGWRTVTDLVSSAPNSAFSPSPATSGDASLYTTVRVNSDAAQLSFKTFYNTESTWDGMVLEVQTPTGGFQDIIAAGGNFVSGGYNITMNAQSPFGTRMAWSGSSTTFVDTVVNMPASLSGQIVRLRWRAVSDTSVTATGTPGLRIDDVAMTNGAFLSGYNCSTITAPISKARADFDGDGRTDISVYRPSEGNWYLNRSTAGFTGVRFGNSTDTLVPADYDGDGKTDTAVVRSGTNLVFYVLNSGNSTVSSIQFGASGDIPAVGDYDNDGKANVAVFRPSNGTWYVLGSNGTTSGFQFGQNGDVPVAFDYDGDSKTDYAVYRSGVWYIARSLGGTQTTVFGQAGDRPVPADYNGDGKVEVAVFRPSNGTWYMSINGTSADTRIQFGNSTDVPVPGDYDGDGKSDVAVFRAGTWFINRSTAGFTGVNFGTSSDIAVPKQYIP